MKLAEFALTPRKILIGLAFLAVATILLIIITLKITKPKELTKPPVVPDKIPAPAVELPPGVGTKPLKNITFDLESTKLPNEALVYKIGSPVISQQQAQVIANNFSMKTASKTTKSANGSSSIWNNQANNETLIITLNSGHIQYSKKAFYARPDIGSGPIPQITDTKQAAALAVNFLNKHNLGHPDITVRNIELLNEVVEGYQPARDLTETSLLQVNFGRKINEVPIYYQFANSFPITVTTDKFQTVTKMTYQYSTVINSPKSFPLLSIEEAKEKLLRGEGTIVNFTPGEPDPKSSAELLSATISSAELVYLDDGKSGFLQPILLFKGKGVFENSVEQEIIVYLPAVKQPSSP